MTAIASGGGHTVALKLDGTVWAWGSNGLGQLGDGTRTNRRTPVQVVTSSGVPLNGAVAIGGGMNHSAVLKSDGTVWTWGFKSSGQLGNCTTTSCNTPVQVVLSSGVPLEGVAAFAGGGVWA